MKILSSFRRRALFNRALRNRGRGDHKQHRSHGGSVRRFLRVRLRRLDQEESYPGREQHVGNVREARAGQSAGGEKRPR